MTLPATWAKQHHVNKGDNLVIEPSDRGVLTVTPELQQATGTKAVVHAQDLDRQSLERVIIGQYVLGRQVIRVEIDDDLTNEQTAAIYGAETQLMGLGVIEETPRTVSVRCSVDSEDFDITNMIRRLENAGSTMRKEAVKALLHGNTELAKRAMNRERQANKIFVLILRLIFTSYQNPRQIRAIGLDSGRPLIGYRSVAKNLELTADNAEDIATSVVEADGEPLAVDQPTIRNISTFSTQVSELSSLAIDTVIEREYDLYRECATLYNEIETAERTLLEAIPEVDNTELLRVRQIIVSLHQTAQYAIRNAEIAANLALDHDSGYVSIT
jgi:phosphate uptake regulator